MGTVATVKVYAADEDAASRQAAAAFGEMRRLEDLFTSYRESELTRLNRRAWGGPVAAPEEMFEILRLSVEYWRKYDGAFDVTVGPAVRAWGFMGGPFRVPAAEERARHEARRTVAFARAGMEVDLGGIAKGYAAEKAARVLAAAGVDRGVVNIGESSYFALGPPPGRSGWPVGVMDPRPPHRVVVTLELESNTALSTSGTYGKSFRRGGRSYSHVIDPRTVSPAVVEGSATVICASGAEAEAASKAVLLLPAGRRGELAAVRWVRLELRGGRMEREQSRNLVSR
jgi:thiamine biosynthesis lipoprotein